MSLLFFPLNLKLIPRTGSYINGRWVNVEGAEIDIKSSFQPTTGEDLQNFPEGERSEDLFKIYTKTEIKGVRQGTDQKGDLIIHNSIRYNVVQVYPWVNGVITHYKAIIRREKES